MSALFVRKFNHGLVPMIPRPGVSHRASLARGFRLAIAELVADADELPNYFRGALHLQAALKCHKQPSKKRIPEETPLPPPLKRCSLRVSRANSTVSSACSLSDRPGEYFLLVGNNSGCCAFTRSLLSVVDAPFLAVLQFRSKTHSGVGTIASMRLQFKVCSSHTRDNGSQPWPATATCVSAGAPSIRTPLFEFLRAPVVPLGSWLAMLIAGLIGTAIRLRPTFIMFISTVNDRHSGTS